jgi:hypothetical protein
MAIVVSRVESSVELVVGWCASLVTPITVFCKGEFMIFSESQGIVG